MIKIKKLSIILILYLLASCGGNNTINDIQSLEQKALEIPPNFELKPPSDSESELIQENIEGEDAAVEEILNLDSNNAESISDDTDSELLDILTTDSNSTSE
jgi:hypothetical protein